MTVRPALSFLFSVFCVASCSLSEKIKNMELDESFLTNLTAWLVSHRPNITKLVLSDNQLTGDDVCDSFFVLNR